MHFYGEGLGKGTPRVFEKCGCLMDRSAWAAGDLREQSPPVCRNLWEMVQALMENTEQSEKCLDSLSQHLLCLLWRRGRAASLVWYHYSGPPKHLPSTSCREREMRIWCFKYKVSRRNSSEVGKSWTFLLFYKAAAKDKLSPIFP